MEGEIESGERLQTPDRILGLFKELAKIQLKQQNEIDEVIKVKNLKRTFDNQVQKSQLVFNQMSSDLSGLQAKFNQDSLRSAVNVKKKHNRTIQNIRSKITDYQEDIKQDDKYLNDKANQFQKKILNQKLKLVDSQHAYKTNSQFFLSSNEAKLNTITKKMQNSLNSSLSSIAFDVKQQYRQLKLQIQKQRKQSVKAQKQMLQKLCQIQQLFYQTVGQQEKQLNRDFDKHYDVLERIFEVISEDLLNEQEI